MKLSYKILATFFLAQAAMASGFPLYHMQPQKQRMLQQQNAHQSSMPAPQWMQQGPQAQMAPTQWPSMMSRPMQNFGQSPQMGGFGGGPQMMGGGFMGQQQQSLRIPAGTGAGPTPEMGIGMGMGMGMSPQIQNQSRMPAGGNALGPQQFAPSQNPQQVQGRGSVGR